MGLRRHLSTVVGIEQVRILQLYFLNVNQIVERSLGGVAVLFRLEDIEVVVADGIGVQVHERVFEDALPDDDFLLFQQFLDVEHYCQIVDVGQGVGRRTRHRVDERHVLNVDAHIREGLDQGKVGLAQLHLTGDELGGVFLDHLGEPPRRGKHRQRDASHDEHHPHEGGQDDAGDFQCLFHD